MIIERYERVGQSEDDLILVSGRSIVSILLDKVSPGYTTEQHASSIPASLVNRICILGNGVSTRDIIPNLSLVWPPAFGEVIEYKSEFVVLYDEIRKLSQEYNFGFRMDYNSNTNGFIFRVVEGVDRRNELVFDPSLGNISDLGYLRTIEEYRNVAYVMHKDRSSPMIVYRHNHEDARGLDRRVIYVNVTDSDPTQWQLRKAGIDALNANGYIGVIDGEVVSDNIRYGRDYYLGDRVQIEDENGRVNSARVTEYIWSYDNNGYRAFPTFTSDEQVIWSD